MTSDFPGSDVLFNMLFDIIQAALDVFSVIQAYRWLLQLLKRL